MSINLWLANRLYPVVPAFNLPITIPASLHTTLFVLSISSLFLLLLFPKKNKLLLVILITELFSCVLDVARWQPWEYQYIFILLVCFLNKNNPKAARNGLFFILVSTYIYSGFHKMNGAFLFSIWERTILHNFIGLPNTTINNVKLHYAGLLLPILEICLGLSLLLLKNKKLPALLLISMHILLLLLLGPLGVNHNSVVWPWNVCIILLLYLLFIRETKPEYNLIAITKKRNVIILFFWGILPILSFVGCWQQYLSSNLYSGNTFKMDICFDDKKTSEQFSEYLSKGKNSVCNGKTRLSVLHWAYTEMNVTSYPEVWYYKRFKKQYEKQYGADNANFIIYRYPYNNIKEVE
ncbi:hypothetical protein [Flavobacterium litorale]|uniref:HTTM domain-containing protein n=1 Tax=Flavobacterium litorale TaxID=2856519 RepID=A0ABX8V4U6_9FLAO|nr:hypothetical protein [Flavobacterium litorale]QYJ67863.1 hypothetical protein K1I41_09970 [Flavobacterium litorale]